MSALLIAKSAVMALFLGTAALSFAFRADDSPVQQIVHRDKPLSQSQAIELPKNDLLDAKIVETYARPLFSPSRRPFVARAVEPVENIDTHISGQDAEPRRSPTNLQLLGVNIFAGKVAVLIRNRETEELRWMTTGEEFQGWILNSADQNSAQFSCRELSSENCSYTADLYVDKRADQNGE